jgi:hypothetical protein
VIWFGAEEVSQPAPVNDFPAARAYASLHRDELSSRGKVTGVVGESKVCLYRPALSSDVAAQIGPVLLPLVFRSRDPLPKQADRISPYYRRTVFRLFGSTRTPRTYLTFTTIQMMSSSGSTQTRSNRTSLPGHHWSGCWRRRLRLRALSRTSVCFPNIPSEVLPGRETVDFLYRPIAGISAVKL